MRTLWNVLSFLAVVHLLALLMVVVWLWQSQRLDAERLASVRETFATTIPEAQAAAAKAEAQANAERQRQIEAERQADPQLDSISQIQHVSLARRQEDQTRRRLADEKRMLQQQLDEATAELESRRAELEQLRAGWSSQAEAQQQRRADEQFLQAVRLMEQIAPKQGKRILMGLIADDQMDQAVAYLKAMNQRAASKILREFKTEAESALATELLERLRTFGLAQDGEASGSEDARNANRSANAQ